MSVTLKDVAKAAGVSASTVSRVINNDPRISDGTREKVNDCIHQLGYRVNSIARSLKTNKTYTVGFICPELTNDFFMNVAKGVEDELRKHGYTTIVCNSNENRDNEKDRIKLLCEKCVDGVILIPATGKGSHFKMFTQYKIPVVLADRLVTGFETDAVLVDNINGTYEAIEYLINSGVTRIGFIGGDMNLTSAKERYEGYIRALKDYRIPIDRSIIKFGDFHTETGFRLMKELIEVEEQPEYVFISNYYMHVGATRYLIENGMTPGTGIHIASFDDMELNSILGFCKITVAQPMAEIGSTAAALLMDRINGSTSPPRIIRLKTRLEKAEIRTAESEQYIDQNKMEQII